jgi:mercuric ion transport protein
MITHRASQRSLLETFRRPFLLISGILTCPCHLPVVLPLLATALGGTAIGVFIQNHMWGIGIAVTSYFIFVAWYAFKNWGSDEFKGG